MSDCAINEIFVRTSNKSDLEYVLCLALLWQNGINVRRKLEVWDLHNRLMAYYMHVTITCTKSLFSSSEQVELILLCKWFPHVRIAYNHTLVITFLFPLQDVYRDNWGIRILLKRIQYKRTLKLNHVGNIVRDWPKYVGKTMIFNQVTCKVQGLARINL